MKWRNREITDFAGIRDAYLDLEETLKNTGFTPECQDRIYWINNQLTERIIDLTRDTD